MPYPVTIETFKSGALANADFLNAQTADGVTLQSLFTKLVIPGIEALSQAKAELVNTVGYNATVDIDKSVAVQAAGQAWQRKTGDRINKPGAQGKMRTWTVRTTREDFVTGLSITEEAMKGSSTEIAFALQAQFKALKNQHYTAILQALYKKGGTTLIDPATNERLVHPSLLDGGSDFPIPGFGTSSFDPQTHSHFMFQDTAAAGWTDATQRIATIKAMVRNLTEHGIHDRIIIAGNGQPLADLMATSEFSQLRTESDILERGSALLELGGARALPTIRGYANFNSSTAIMRAVGTFDNATVVDSQVLPLNYLLIYSFSGPGAASNPVQWRETPITMYTDTPWAVYETFMETSFGASIRNRVNGVVVFLGSGASAYVTPTAFVDASAATGDWNGV